MEDGAQAGQRKGGCDSFIAAIPKVNEPWDEMHITLESDYALRIVDYLARNPGRVGAKTIAEKSNVTLRFSLKILRKLVATGIVRSYKGAQGGYEIARSPEEISLNDILETIEGPYALSRCLYAGYECTHQEGEKCPYYHLFADISAGVQEQLKSVTISNVMEYDQASVR